MDTGKMSINIETEIQYLAPTDLKFYEHNAKIHRGKLGLLKKSIQLFGFDQPVVVDEDMVLLKGHGRVMAAQNLSDVSRLPTIPVIVRTGLTEAQKKAIRIMDNLVFEEGSDDISKKSDILLDVSVDEVNLFYSLDLPDVSDMDLAMGTAPPPSSKNTKNKSEESDDITIHTCPKCDKGFEEES